MGFEQLEQNLVDVIVEEQIKLGYRSEQIGLYYPLASLNRLLGTDCPVAEMKEELKRFREYASERLGTLVFSNQGERFCIKVPAEGVEYVHTHSGDHAFLRAFIQTISKHGCTYEDIRQVFCDYSDKVHVEKMNDEEFDYLFYFEDGRPDDYRYCVTFEECHATYHRFTVDDYVDLGFGQV